MKYKMFISGISNSSFIGLHMRHRVYIIIGFCILIGFVCVSCASNNSVRYRIGSTKYIQSVSDIKFHDISDMSKPFRTDGYYIRKDKDTTLIDDRIIIFYNDGTFSEHIIKSPDESNEAVEINKYIMKSSILSNNGEYFGVYRIDADTIFVNEYRRELFMFGYDLYKLRFYIIDNETLLFYYLEDPQLIYNNETIKFDKSDVYIFKKAILPMPRDKFLKKNKWMWKNETDWEHYLHKK